MRACILYGGTQICLEPQNVLQSCCLPRVCMYMEIAHSHSGFLSFSPSCGCVHILAVQETDIYVFEAFIIEELLSTFIQALLRNCVLTWLLLCGLGAWEGWM